eukprot:7696770-Alexandrium_andersonii.AAC.1
MLGVASGLHALLPVPVQALVIVWLAMLGIALSAGGTLVAPHLAASLAPQLFRRTVGEVASAMMARGARFHVIAACRGEACS